MRVGRFAPSPSGPLAQGGNAMAHWTLAAGSHPWPQDRDMATRRGYLACDPAAAARSATGFHLPRRAQGVDLPRPRSYLALPYAGQRTADGWRRLTLCAGLLTLRPTRRLGLVQHPRFA